MKIDWPEEPLQVEHGELSGGLVSKGCSTFAQAVDWIHELPYGRTPDRADWRQVLEHERGTCSTKHALIAALAEECSIPIGLVMGIYMMSEENTPGVARGSSGSGLSELPEAHCFLKFQGQFVDLTSPSEVRHPPEMLQTWEIEPWQIGDFKVQTHRAFVAEWARSRGLEFEDVWRIREACIASLSADREVSRPHPV